MRSEMISKVGLGFVVSILMFSGLAFAQGLQDIIGVAKDIGVFQFYLPFIIAFAIIFGILQKLDLLKSKGLHVIVALAISAFVMVYTPIGITLSQFFTNLFGNAIVVILTIVVVAIFASVLGAGGIFDLKKVTDMKYWWVIGLIFLLLIAFGVFIASGGTSIFPGLKIGVNPSFDAIAGISTTTWALIILIVGTGLIAFFLVKGGGAAAPK